MVVGCLALAGDYDNREPSKVGSIFVSSRCTLKPPKSCLKIPCSGSAHLLSEHSLLHLCGGRLRPQPHGKNHLPDRRAGNGQLVLATDGEGRARARNVGEGHLIAHFGGIERAEKSVNV